MELLRSAAPIKTQHDADAPFPQPLSQDQTGNLPPRRTDGAAHANLTRPLRHVVGQHAIDAEGRQEQGQTGKRGEQQHHGTTVVEGRTHRLLQAAGVKQWKRGIDGAHFVAQGRHHVIRRPGLSAGTASIRPAVLPERVDR